MLAKQKEDDKRCQKRGYNKQFFAKQKDEMKRKLSITRTERFAIHRGSRW